METSGPDTHELVGYDDWFGTTIETVSLHQNKMAFFLVCIDSDNSEQFADEIKRLTRKYNATLLTQKRKH